MKASTLLTGAIVGAIGIYAYTKGSSKARQITRGDVFNDILVPGEDTLGTAIYGGYQATERFLGEVADGFNRGIDFGAAGLNAITPDFVSLREGASFAPGATNYVDASNPVSRTVNKAFEGDETLGGFIHDEVVMRTRAFFGDEAAQAYLAEYVDR